MLHDVKPTLANVKRLAAKLGATVDYERSRPPFEKFPRIHIDLPTGKHWVENETNTIIDDGAEDTTSERAAMFYRVIEAMLCGVEDCPYSGCENCD